MSREIVKLALWLEATAEEDEEEDCGDGAEDEIGGRAGGGDERGAAFGLHGRGGDEDDFRAEKQGSDGVAEDFVNEWFESEGRKGDRDESEGTEAIGGRGHGSENIQEGSGE